ncbi:MAG: hypothetical protein K2Y51_13695 [Gammaproteobacteria bacterium]|nr:hypothetical protein [Gammaproteobacteria bacterium]
MDVEAVLARQAEAIQQSTGAMVAAVREEMRQLAGLVVDSKRGKVRVEIERNREGNMTALVIERVKTKGH